MKKFLHFIMLLYILQVVMMVNEVLTQTDRWYCPYILNTSKLTSSCPKTEDEHRAAAGRLNCTGHSWLQNCTSPQQFQYHCVIGAEGTHLYEVCAEDRFILGYCTEFNIAGARIQGHYSKKCTEMDPPCPARYRSSEAFKYPVCYKLPTEHYEDEGTYNNTADSTTGVPENNICVQDDALNPENFIYLVIGNAIFLLVLGVAVVTIIYRRERIGLQNDRRRYCLPWFRRSSENPQEISGNQENNEINRIPEIRNGETDIEEQPLLNGLTPVDVDSLKEPWLSGRELLINSLEIISNAMQTTFSEQQNKGQTTFSSFRIRAAMVASYVLPASLIHSGDEFEEIKVNYLKIKFNDIRQHCTDALHGLKTHITDTQKVYNLLNEFQDRGDQIVHSSVSNISRVQIEERDYLPNELHGLPYNAGYTGRIIQDIDKYLKEILEQPTSIDEEFEKHIVLLNKVIESLKEELLKCRTILCTLTHA